MFPRHTQQVLGDLERGVRRKAPHERRWRTERTRHDPFGMDPRSRAGRPWPAEAPFSECEDGLAGLPGRG